MSFVWVRVNAIQDLKYRPKRWYLKMKVHMKRAVSRHFGEVHLCQDPPSLHLQEAYCFIYNFLLTTSIIYVSFVHPRKSALIKGNWLWVSLSNCKILFMTVINITLFNRCCLIIYIYMHCLLTYTQNSKSKTKMKVTRWPEKMWDFLLFLPDGLSNSFLFMYLFF